MWPDFGDLTLKKKECKLSSYFLNVGYMFKLLHFRYIGFNNIYFENTLIYFYLLF